MTQAIIKFQEIAAEIARNLQGSATSLQRELFDIEARKTAIEAELHAAHLSLKRLADFKVKIGADYQCPRCWVMRGVISALRQVNSSSHHEDWYRCDTCGLEPSVNVPH